MGKAKAAAKQKMSLGDFLGGDEGPSSWADEMDAMPTAPGQFSDMASGFRRPGGDRPGFGDTDRDARPPRQDVPFPTAPPYTAFVGNMSFECTQEEVKDLFVSEGLTVTNVRMVTDYGGKSKGFCYAEFPEPEMLRKALDMSGTQLAGRTIRVSVAEPPKAGAEGRSAGDWTRSGPLPDLPGRGGSRPGGFGDRNERTPSSGPMDSGRDWGDARGSKFAPSVPSSPALGSSRGSAFGDRRDGPSSSTRMGFGMGRDREFSNEGGAPPPPQEERDWTSMRGGKYVASPVTSAAPSAAAGNSDWRASAAAPASSAGDTPGGPERKASGEGENARDWRARASGASPSAEEAPSAPTPVERRKLQLAPRSAASTDSTPSSPAPGSATTPSSRSNPFGAAQPVDTAAREQALLDARIEKERAEAEERRKAAEAADAEVKSKKAAAEDINNSKADAGKKDADNWRARDAAKVAEDRSANPAREWNRPKGPHAGLTDQQATAPASALADSSEAKAEGTSTTITASASSTTSTGGDEAKSAEEKSANPTREWNRPKGPHAGLTDQQATAPSSELANASEAKANASASEGTAWTTKSAAAKPAAEKEWRRSGPNSNASSSSNNSNTNGRQFPVNSNNNNNRARDGKTAEDKSANPNREWKRPSGPHAGLTAQQASAPSSVVATAAEAKTSPAPTQFQKNQGIRKEGFSYSNIAGASSKAPAASSEDKKDGDKPAAAPASPAES